MQFFLLHFLDIFLQILVQVDGVRNKTMKRKDQILADIALRLLYEYCMF